MATSRTRRRTASTARAKTKTPARNRRRTPTRRAALCPWCGQPTPVSATGTAGVCPRCGIHGDPVPARPSSSRRTPTARTNASFGLCPGHDQSALVVRAGEQVLFATAIQREAGHSDSAWALTTVAVFDALIARFDPAAAAPMVVVDVTDQTPAGGRVAAAVVFGALLGRWPAAAVAATPSPRRGVPYPSELTGARQLHTPGSGPRTAERVAYDAAGLATSPPRPARSPRTKEGTR